MDFIHDGLLGGKSFRAFNVIDDFNREILNITIDTSAQGVSGASVGKYIGDRVFIGYRQRFTETPYENNIEGHLEYEISRAVSAEVTYGDRTSNFSVLYTKEF